MIMDEENGFTLLGWILIAVILLAQGTYLFLDARKRGHNPWFWGTWGIIQVPTPTIIYFLVARGLAKKIWRGVKRIWKN